MLLNIADIFEHLKQWDKAVEIFEKGLESSRSQQYGEKDYFTKQFKERLEYARKKQKNN